ncbi:hemin receptor [Chitinophaga terrae (ex Kim and Jung 2007)]|nr:hemin receptor [Chitinophaga terrae (ex Kim and Jung 2007)]
MQPHGTARTQALGGVGAGLGGDYSSAHINPAGIGIFKTGEFFISAGVGITNNTSNYLGNNQLDNTGNRTNFQIPNIGVIFATNFNSGPDRWNNVTFSLGVNRLANYNSKMAIAGVNAVSSYSNIWVEQLQGASLNYFEAGDPTGASLGYQSLLIDTVRQAGGGLGALSFADPRRNQTDPRIGPLEGVTQRGTLTKEGGMNEYAFAVGGNYGDRLYIGASVVLPSINYKETFSWSEDDRAENNQNNYFGFFDYNKYLTRTGLGIGGKLGLLYKVTDRFRLGAAVHTPTYFSIHDSYSGDIHTNTENFGGETTVYSDQLTNDGGPQLFDYNYVTPMKLLAGASFFFGDLTDPKKPQGFISADYEYVNQASAKFKIKDDRQYERMLNDNISAIYKSVSNFRAGAELKLASLYAIRAGYAYYGNPYSNDYYNAGADGSTNVFSGGVGVRTKGLYVDLTYSYAESAYKYRPYTTANAETTPAAAAVDYNRSNIMMTIGFKF